MKATKHTCGGPVFGKRTAGCPRCDELAAGAPVREQPWRKSYLRTTTGREFANQFCSCQHTPLGARCESCGRYPYCD